MTRSSSETNRLLHRATDGGVEAWSVLLTRYKARLRRIVSLRLDPRLKRRLDPSDVLQEVFLVASQNLANYLRQPPVPFYDWLRGIANHKLLELHRHHLGTPMRDARREVSPFCGPFSDASSAALASRLLGNLTPPCEASIRAEDKVRLQEALNTLDPDDREILVLRHFEQLSSAEAADVLGIRERAASKRHLRALRRLRATLTGISDGRQRPGI
jgi:RNA polymerase sigma-70 factor (ECF subfamily)